MILPLIVGVAIAFGAINMGFKQGQANPNANGFPDSKASFSTK